MTWLHWAIVSLCEGLVMSLCMVAQSYVTSEFWKGVAWILYIATLMHLTMRTLRLAGSDAIDAILEARRRKGKRKP